MTHRDRILNEVQKTSGLTAKEISRRLFKSNPTQQRVNPYLIKLCADKLIRRDAGRPFRYYPADSSRLAQPIRISPRSENLDSPFPHVDNIEDLRSGIGDCPLFIIPCCARKILGGNLTPPPPLFMMRDPTMIRCRLSAANVSGGSINPAALEFGCPHPAPVPYRPAWERYDGDLYRTVNRANPSLLQNSDFIMIMSALYGLLKCHDRIQNYDLEMKRVRRIWQPALPSLIVDEANILKATAIVGILSRDMHNHSYAGVFRGLQHIEPRPLTYLVSTIGPGTAHIIQGLGHALLYLKGAAALPIGFRYYIQSL